MPDHAPISSSPFKRGQRLTISYPLRGGTAKRSRRVAYIRYGEEPVTDAEIEIMRAHLDVAVESSKPCEAANDH